MSFWNAFKAELHENCLYWILSFLFLVGWVLVYLSMTHQGVWLQSPIALLPVLLFIFFVIGISSLKYRFPSFLQELRIIESIFKLYAIFFVCYSLSPILLTTPYHPISHTLLEFDRGLGFDQSKLMLWLLHHPVLLSVLHLFYSSMLFVAMILFAISSCFDRKAVMVSLSTLQFGLLLASVCFFFLPSTSPIFFTKELLLSKKLPSVMINFFMQSTHDVRQLALVRLGKAPLVNHVFHAGFIAFPSVHFFSAVVLFILSRKALGKFSVLFLIYGLFILVSVFALGEHYLLDVVGAVVLFFISNYCSSKLIG